MKTDVFYKAAAIQITDTGKVVGTAVFTKDFNALQKAKEYAEGHLLSPLSIIEIREYDQKQQNIVAFMSQQDTGIRVLRDISGIKNEIIKVFKEACEESCDWDSTLSYMIDAIKDADSERPMEWDYLKDAINMLSDEEINDILSYDGSNEYMICENGQIVPNREIELD